MGMAVLGLKNKEGFQNLQDSVGLNIPGVWILKKLKHWMVQIFLIFRLRLAIFQKIHLQQAIILFQKIIW